MKNFSGSVFAYAIAGEDVPPERYGISAAAVTSMPGCQVMENGDTIASTFLSTSAWNADCVPSGVSMSMSTTSSFSGRPLAPPAALISSIAISRAVPAVLVVRDAGRAGLRERTADEQRLTGGRTAGRRGALALGRAHGRLGLARDRLGLARDRLDGARRLGAADDSGAAAEVSGAALRCCRRSSSSPHAAATASTKASNAMSQAWRATQRARLSPI